LWHLYAVSLIQAVFAIFQRPAFSASVTMLVPDDHRDRANAIRELTSPTASIIAPIFAGLLFAVIGVAGVMAIDLFTFLVAVAVVAIVHIPRPVQSVEGRAAQHDSIWRESLVGFKFMKERPALLYMVIYVSLLNFLLTFATGLNAAYILGLTDNEAALGTINGVFGIGAVAGGIIMSVWGGTRPRIHTIMPGIFSVGVGMVLYGLSRSPLALGISIVVVALPLPMVNASFSSILQLKIPPDLQGRVFASLGQISQLLMPLAYLLAGPLADRVFEPAVGGSHWGIVAPLVGSQTGSGIGLIMVICGSLGVLATVIAYSIPLLRHMETLLPDYEPVTAEGDADDQPAQVREPVLA
jgi:DHA3 family macrolide efflux protein-like MFS transporter